VKLRFVEQKEINGTAGAVWLGHEAFDEDVLIIFGDTIFATDLSAIKHSKDDAIIWTMHVDDPRRFGVIVTDKDGYAQSMVEKPTEPVSNLANIGVYWVKNTKLLADGIQHVLARKTTDREAYLTDAFSFMLEHKAKIKTLPCTGWYDCGTPQAMLDTNRALLERDLGKHDVKIDDTITLIPPVAIHASAHLERCVIGPHVTIGALVTIKDSVISDSIIDERATVLNSVLDKSIIGEAARIESKKRNILLGDHSVLE
jgi:glucose-1-phosphate thymidylyltransferase